MMRIGRQRLLSIIFFTVLFSVITITVVYAALSTSLTITGSTDVVASTWDLYITNASFATSIPTIDDDPTSAGHTTPQGNVYDSYKVVPLAGHDACIVNCIEVIDKTSLSFTTDDILAPGDFKAISFDVINGGSIDAKLDGYTLSGLDSSQDVYLNYYILYSDGTTPKSGDTLTVGSTKSMVLVIEFDEDITASQLPTTNQNLSLSFTLNYVQN